jgi:integrase
MKQQQNAGIRNTMTVFKELDSLLNSHRVKDITLSREIYLKWHEMACAGSERTRYTKILVFRRFCKYLCNIGYASYIPPVPRRPKTSYTPHIFTEEEVMRIFQTIDHTELERRHSTTCLIALPTIFRFLYYCGARIGEVLSIKNEDVNLSEGFITLTETKNRQHRLIPLNEQMKGVICTYLHYRDKMPIATSAMPESYLFTNYRGEKISCSAVYTRFKEILRQCGITHVGHGQGPRVHDMRHTFAVHSLHHMAKSGLDIYTAWPILSTLLGHRDIYMTEHYVRLALEVYPDLYKAVGDKLSSIFPDITTNYEENF